MDKQARLDGPSATWRLVVARLRALAPTVAERVTPALRLGRRLFPLTRPWMWRYALLPIAVTVTLLAAMGWTVDWWLAVSEALSAICALAAWGALRAYRPQAHPDYAWIGVGVALALLAALLALPLAMRAFWGIAGLGLLALAPMALDAAGIFTRWRIPTTVTLVAWRVVTPALLGIGLVAATALAQGAQLTATMWLVGVSLSLLAFAAIRARSLAAERGPHVGTALWRRPVAHVAAALAVAGVLVVWVALPRGAPHGLLIALGTLPLALVALSGLGRSTFQPAREWAAKRMGALFTWAALAMTGGALASAAVAGAVAALTRALGL